MTRHYKDWTIETCKVHHLGYGNGFIATAYIAKTDGTKVRVFARFDGIKNQKEMLVYTQKLLEI